MINKNLCIAIPTYNRAEILDENLKIMLPNLARYNIGIFVSDDSTNDETEKAIINLQKDYNNLFYSKNLKSLGHDLNCEYTIKSAYEKFNSDYIWYIGDSILIDEINLEKVLTKTLKDNYDLIVVDDIGRMTSTESKIYTNSIEFFRDLAWHITITGVTIYNKKVIDKANFKKFYGTDFIQTGITLEYLALNDNISISWNEDIKIISNKKKVSYWNNKMFEVFIKKWSDFIFSLPSNYSTLDKIECIKQHDLKTNLFSLRNIIRLRRKGIFNFSILKKYFKYYKYAVNIPIWKLFLISITPVSFLQIIKSILDRFKDKSS